MSAISPLNHLHRHMLTQLVEAGHGVIDTAGRVCIGPERAPIAGDSVAWLFLMVHGMVAGERGLVLPTEDAREWVQHRVGGTVRESRGA